MSISICRPGPSEPSVPSGRTCFDSAWTVSNNRVRHLWWYSSFCSCWASSKRPSSTTSSHASLPSYCSTSSSSSRVLRAAALWNSLSSRCCFSTSVRVRASTSLRSRSTSAWKRRVERRCSAAVARRSSSESSGSRFRFLSFLSFSFRSSSLPPNTMRVALTFLPPWVSPTRPSFASTAWFRCMILSRWASKGSSSSDSSSSSASSAPSASSTAGSSPSSSASSTSSLPSSPCPDPVSSSSAITFPSPS
mmetsp:Transcript_33605/g.60264  ORF Transcript_33605/g.60264 Transcript_33605/m.60264 type:complete len:249 (+) Transcript_33605:383-1129(+)